jgi:hypothetical protein
MRNVVSWPPPTPKDHEIVGWIVRNPDNLTDDDRGYTVRVTGESEPNNK